MNKAKILFQKVKNSYLKIHNWLTTYDYENNTTVSKPLKEKLLEQANQKNLEDCKQILNSINLASNKGEYYKIVQMKVNQALYLEKLGLTVTLDRVGHYKVSWENL